MGEAYNWVVSICLNDLGTIGERQQNMLEMWAAVRDANPALNRNRRKVIVNRIWTENKLGLNLHQDVRGDSKKSRPNLKKFGIVLVTCWPVLLWISKCVRRLLYVPLIHNLRPAWMIPRNVNDCLMRRISFWKKKQTSQILVKADPHSHRPKQSLRTRSLQKK